MITCSQCKINSAKRECVCVLWELTSASATAESLEDKNRRGMKSHTLKELVTEKLTMIALKVYYRPDLEH